MTKLIGSDQMIKSNIQYMIGSDLDRPKNIGYDPMNTPNLNDVQNRLQRRVQDAQNNCQVIEADVATWLTTFGQISRAANTFLNHPDHATVVCSCGSPPHLLMRHRLSRKAKKMWIQVHDLKEECKFDTIAYPPHLHTLSTTTATTTTSATKGYESFYSRRVILENIMAAVRDGNRKRIGLHGMGGIGKTMLAKEIHRLAEEEELFSKVVITTISQAPNIKEIQQHIAEMLDMTNFSQNESIGKRAELLRTRLEQDESKILLILDDIWKELNLEEIGIHDGCKILVTSRYLHVLRNSMGMAESDVFFIGALKSSEAINLFMKIIGDTKVENNGDYNGVALKIVDECGGLPISIATVAHALKCNMDSLFIWEDALQRLRSSNFTGIEGMHDKVYKSIRLSYDFLGSHEEEAKLLLLLCALHKEDQQIQVEDLIRYFVGWQSLQGIYRVEDARNRVNSLVVKLKSHCLLLDGWSKSTMKMHDVIRDVCITIGKEDHGHRMMSNIVMYEDERPKASKAISFLHYDDFDNLPAELECPSLELLLLCSSSALKSIPEEFFKQTGLLKVLIMNRTWIGSLPSSFASLQNLQTLCLRGSNYLKDMTVIGELKNLKALDLSKSDSIKLLPKEIGALQRLQVLDLRGCRNLRVIEANVISNLTQMEELYLPREFEGWDKIIDEEGGIRNASLIEIKSLKRLTALHLYVPREHVLPEGLFSEKLERYQICIGVEKLMRRSECLSLVGLSLSQLEQVYARELISLMRRSECLSLTGSMSVNNVSPSLVNEGFPRLKHMGFHDNDGVQCIINSTDVAFPCLESLILQQLRSLESIICDGGNNKLPRGSFNQLRKVDVWRCGRLKNLFPLSVAKLLHEIIVQECEMIEEIIVREDGEEVGHIIDGDDQSSLQLRCLHLGSLPKLVQFYCSNVHRPARESYHPKPLFSETVSLPNLEDLTMKGVNIEKLWPEQLMVSSTSYMQNLTSLKVGSCHNLKYLFSSSVAQKFVNLKSIQVKDCNAMKDIIRVVDQPGEKEIFTHHDQIDRIDLLSKLEFVELVGLSSLQRFCSATDSSPCMVFPLLSKLHIKYCSTMKEQATAVSTQGPFFDKKVSFPKLEQLILDRMNTGKLWPDQLMVSSSSSSYMQNLTSLEVEECNNLKYLFSFSLAQKFVNLKKIKVKNCEAMEDIIKVVDQPGEEALHMERIDLFPKLQSLELDGLSSLQRFCCVTDSSSYMVFPLLSKLTIEDCPQMKAFVSCPTEPFYSEKVCFPNLEDLTMKKMEIEMLWPEQLMLSSTSSFYMQNLTTLEVRSCHNLKYVFSFSLAQKFVNLKSIKVEDCEAMEDIIRVVDQPGEEESTHHDHDQMERIDLLPKLGSVELVGLSSLQTFCTATNSSLCMVFPLLIKLDIINCSTLMNAQATLSTQEPFFNKKVCFPNLEELSMWDMSIEKLLADQLMVSSSSSFYMQNLTTLEVEGCDSLKYVFSFSLAQKFVNLQSIRVGYCEGMEDIIRVVDQPGEEESTRDHDQIERIDLVPKLGSVKLCGLSALQRFCSSSADSCIMVFPLLSKLDIINCSTMKAQATLSTQEPFFNKKVCFPNLEELSMWDMSIEKLLPDQVVVSSPSSYMQNLTTLEVKGCDSLKYVFSFSVAQKFVNLQSIRVKDCEAMEDIIRVVDQPGEEETTHHNQMKRIDLFPKLEFLHLHGLSSLQKFSSAEKIAFPNLKKLDVQNCNKMKSLLSSAMARNLVQLERLSIYGCEKMEEVIVSDEEYSSSGGSNINAIIPFQKLDSLELNDLPNLIRFCELGDYCIECPLLSKMIVLGCPKLKELFMGDKRTSSSSSLSCTITTTDNNIIGEEMDRMVSAPNKQILFKHNNKVILPMLKVLRSDWSEGIKEIFEMMSSNSIVLFPNLDTLGLTCTSGDEPIGVPDLKLFLHKYHTIRTLKLRGSFVNLSNNGDGEVINNTTTTHLTSPSTPSSSSSSSSLEQLYIDGADDMVDHVFGVEPSSHNNTMILLFPNLKRVDVSRCSRLQSFAPSFMCFPNLETLEVSECHGLTYLFSSATAATLVQLQRMVIIDCDEMKEIIINHNGNEEQEKEENPRIVFQNLKELWLTNLPSLQSFFYSGNKVTMSIPNLEQLSIWRCPEMRRFSDGIVDPSASISIEVDGETIHVEIDDVNATLAKLFREDNNRNNNSDLGLRQQ